MARTINWNRYHAGEKERYDYYLSLGYDEHTAAVLAIVTFGKRRYERRDIEELYETLLAQEDPSPAIYPDSITSSRTPGYGSYASSGGRGPVMSAPDAANDMDLEEGMSLSNLADSMFEDENLADCAGRAAPPTRASRKSMKKSSSPASAPIPRASASMPRASAMKSGGIGGMFRSLIKNTGMPLSAPMATDEYETIEEKDFRQVATQMTSTFRMTTNTASAGVVLNQLRSGRRLSKDMVRIEEMLNYCRYISEKPEQEKFRISYEIMPSTSGKKLLYINVQGKEEVKARQNIVILMDVSGSMSWNTTQVQAAIATIIMKLNPGDKISLVTYSNRDEVVFSGMGIGSYKDKIAALEKLLCVEVDGWTNGSAGIEKAYEIGKAQYIEGGNNQVILITDGDLNFGITDKGGLEQLIEEKKKSNLFLSVLGTGLTNYKDDKLEVLSKHGNGVYRTVNNLADVKKCIDKEYASLVNIIAKDVKAEVEFNPEVVESMRLLGFENREISHEDFVNDKVISEPFGSGGYGIALYELVLRDKEKPVESGYKYAKVVTTGSTELGTVKVRYKEPLEDTSREIEYVIPSAEDTFTDNIKLAYVVYVCAEKLRGSDKITDQDVQLAQQYYDSLGEEIRKLNEADLYKLPEILRRTERELNVGIRARDRFEW